jgi:hypothetical protein
MEAINQKRISSSVALGQEGYTGLSDSNLVLFNRTKNTLWARTVKNRLDHIGWEMYIDMNNEYVREKEKNLAEKKIRHNRSLEAIELEEEFLKSN